NGEEVDRELISEEVKRESEQRVVAVGTKEIKQLVARGGDTSSQSTPTNSSSNSSSSSSSSSSSNSSSSSSSSSNSSSNSKSLTMTATAYNWDCSSCDGRGLTSTGYDLKANPDGVIAVDPSVIPLGTK